MEDGRDVWINSIVFILLLFLEEGSVSVDDFFQEYDNESCVRRVRLVILGGEVSVFKNFLLVSKKVRFFSEDNLVYELRYGFFDEEKFSGFFQKLDFDFIDDCYLDDQMLGLEIFLFILFFFRYFSDLDGLFSFCILEFFLRLFKNEVFLEEFKIYRILLQKSLKMLVEKKILEEDRDEYICKEGFYYEEGFFNDNFLKDKFYVSENLILRRF